MDIMNDESLYKMAMAIRIGKHPQLNPLIIHSIKTSREKPFYQSKLSKMAFKNVSLVIALFSLSMVAVSFASDDYGNGYYDQTPKLDDKPKPSSDLLPQTIGVQGIIYCKSGPKLLPIEGAVAKIKCMTVDENGYESNGFTQICLTDAKGYFYATFLAFQHNNEQQKLTKCLAFLESSPLKSCDLPTDINYGNTGAPLHSFRFVHGKNMKLYSMKPFVYTPKNEPVSNGY